MRHLYDKLGAHRRLEAIDRGRALGLLAPVPQRALTFIYAGRTRTWRLAGRCCNRKYPAHSWIAIAVPPEAA